VFNLLFRACCLSLGHYHAKAHKAQRKRFAWLLYLGVACGRAVRLYCTGISRGPVSAAIPNAFFVRDSFFGSRHPTSKLFALRHALLKNY